MRKDDVDKEPTTLYLEKDIKFLAKSQELNLSGLVNDLLRTYFSVGSKEDIYKEIEKHRGALAVLEEKLRGFKEDEVAETRVEATMDAAWEHAFDVFKIRCDGEIGEANVREWVKHAKATEALRRSGLQVDEIVYRLTERYHGLQED